MSFQLRATRLLFTILFLFGAAIAVGDGKKDDGHGSPASGGTGRFDDPALVSEMGKILRAYFPVSGEQADNFAKDILKGEDTAGTVFGELMGSIKYKMKQSLEKIVDEKIKELKPADAPADDKDKDKETKPTDGKLAFYQRLKSGLVHETCKEMEPHATGQAPLWDKDKCKAEKEAAKIPAEFTKTFIPSREVKEVRTVGYLAANAIGGAKDAEAAETARKEWLEIAKKIKVSDDNTSGKSHHSDLIKALENMKPTEGNLRSQLDDMLTKQGFNKNNFKEYAAFYGDRINEDKGLLGDVYKDLRGKDLYKDDVTGAVDRMVTRDENGHHWLHLGDESIHIGTDKDFWQARAESIPKLASLLSTAATPGASQLADEKRSAEAPKEIGWKRMRKYDPKAADPAGAISAVGEKDPEVEKWKAKVETEKPKDDTTKPAEKKIDWTKATVDTAKTPMNGCINCHTGAAGKASKMELRAEDGKLMFGDYAIDEAYDAMKTKAGTFKADNPKKGPAEAALSSLNTYLENLKK